MKEDKGFTLMELLVVVTVAVVLAIYLGFEFTGWQGRYKAESQIKKIYVDLMNTRARAMQRNRSHFITLDSAIQYTIYEDTDPAPDGDGILTPGSDTQIRQETLDITTPITWSDLADTEIEFTSRGLSNDDKTICINIDLIDNDPSPSGADYDCIIISPTRINMGKLTTSIPDGGECNATNCVAK